MTSRLGQTIGVYIGALIGVGLIGYFMNGSDYAAGGVVGSTVVWVVTAWRVR